MPLFRHNNEHSTKRVNFTLNSSSARVDLRRISCNFFICISLNVTSNLFKYPPTSCMSPFASTFNPLSTIPIIYPKLSGLGSNSLPWTIKTDRVVSTLSTNHLHHFCWSQVHFISINLPNPIEHTPIPFSAINLDATNANQAGALSLSSTVLLSKYTCIFVLLQAAYF